MVAKHKIGGGYAWFIWCLAVTFVVYLFTIQTGYAIINANLEKDFLLSPEQVGKIAATYTWVFAFCQFFSGPFLDLLSPKKVIPVAILLVALGVFTFANAPNFRLLIFSQILLASGACFGFVGAGYVGGEWFGIAKFSLMFGLVQMITAFSSAVSQNLLLFALKHFSWRSLFNMAGVFGLILFIISKIFMENAKSFKSNYKPGIFLHVLFKNILEVIKIPHLWISCAIGASTFGTLLSLGVVYAPKLLTVRGASAEKAVFGSSLIWLGLTFGCAFIPYWSDFLKKRKLPLIGGCLIQLISLLILIYLPTKNSILDLSLCFVFGFSNSIHMLAFSTVSDVVQSTQIGTAAAIVNGSMFLMGGLMIQLPGERIVSGIIHGIQKGSMEMLAHSGKPLVISLLVALLFSIIIKESYPHSKSPDL